MAKPPPYITKTLRMRDDENTVIEQARAALRRIDRAQLMQEAVLHEALRLGINFGVGAVPRLPYAWPYLPDRSAGPTGVRVSITIPVTVAELMSRAAAVVGTSEPLFIIGATLAHVGRLQAGYWGAHTASPKEARECRAALGRVQLPERYRLLRLGDVDEQYQRGRGSHQLA